MRIPTTEDISKVMTMQFVPWLPEDERWYLEAMIVPYGYGTSSLVNVNGFWWAILRKVLYNAIIFVPH